MNGPYAVEHHRDGNIVHHIYIGNKSLSTKLPRNVWPSFRPLMKSEETQALIARENAKWAAQEDDE